MVDLASHNGEGPVARQDIAERQDISADYVAQLFRPLQEAGLVEGVKGPGGGYRLTRRPDQIRARDVVEAVEGAVELVPCLEPQGRDCPHVNDCATRNLWEELAATMRQVLDSYTLQDLRGAGEEG
jgi:Rrf2 family protein